MISDEQLLELCRAAESGGPAARRRARLAYRASVREWRERDGAWQQEHAEAVVREQVAEVAGTVFLAVMLKRGLAGRRVRCPQTARA